MHLISSVDVYEEYNTQQQTQYMYYTFIIITGNTTSITLKKPVLCVECQLPHNHKNVSLYKFKIIGKGVSLYFLIMISLGCTEMKCLGDW